jgi:NADH:ubiquinone oxidoreductase subunit 2 (subunit N)
MFIKFGSNNNIYKNCYFIKIYYKNNNFKIFESNLYLILLFSVFLSIISTFYYLRLIKIIIFEKSNILNFLESNLIVSYITKFMSFVITCCFFSLFLLFMFPLPLYLTTYYLTLLSF